MHRFRWLEISGGNSVARCHWKFDTPTPRSVWVFTPEDFVDILDRDVTHLCGCGCDVWVEECIQFLIESERTSCRSKQNKNHPDP